MYKQKKHLVLPRSIDHAESSKYGKGCSLAYFSFLRPLVSLGSHHVPQRHVIDTGVCKFASKWGGETYHLFQ